MSSNKKGPRSNFTGRSNATANGKASSSSASATATPASSTSTTTTSTTATPTTTTNAWFRPLQQPQKPARPPPGMSGPTPNEQKVMENITHHNNPNLQITLRDRFLHLTVSMVGQKVVLTQTNGAVIEGLFCTFTPFASQPPSTRNIYVIKACRLIKPPTAPDAQLTSLKDGETVMIPADKVSNVLVKSMRLDAVTGSNNGNTTPTTTIASGATNAASATASAAGAASTKGGGDMFQTDGDIASAKHGARSGDLIAAGSAWTSPVVASSSTNSRADALLGGLEDNKTINGPSRSSGIANSNSKPSSATTATPTTATTAGTTTIGSSTAGGLRGNIGEWDQFKANEELFNVSATFDENLYTTELDKSLIDAKRIAEAERIAREIEQTTSSNIHVAEERGHAVQTDYDEEDRFSGVLPTTTGAARSRKEKSNHAPSALPVTNSRASALLKGTTTTTADGPKKTAPPPVKKMNYAAAVAAQADSKKSVAAAGVASSGARVTPERSTPSDAAASRTLEEKASLEADKVTVDEERMSHVPAMETTPHTSDEQVEQHLAEEVANLVMDDRVAEEKTVEHATDDTAVQHQNATSAEEQPPMEDGSEPKATDSAAEAAAKKLSSKLNANAKEFTFNPTAKTFTPSFPTSVQIPAIPDPAHFVDPNTGMPMGHAMPPQMHGVHYMPPGHMSQHGMMPMMNPQFQYRFQPPYPTMDQSMPPMLPQQHQQMQPPLQQPVAGEQHSGTPSSGSGSVLEDDAMSLQQQQQQQQQRDPTAQQPAPHMPQIPQQQQQGQLPPQQQMQNQQMPMQYHVPPPGAGYFTPGMPMQQRGPGGVPQMSGYHPQFMAPQQMQMVPGGGPYRHMYPMQPGMPPNMPMRAPYYPAQQGAPMHYPPNAFMGGGGRMMEDGDYRGGRSGRNPTGRGRRASRGRSGGGTGGRPSGRTYYHPGGGGSGRQTPQTPTEMDGVLPPDMQDGTMMMPPPGADMATGIDDHQREPAD